MTDGSFLKLPRFADTRPAHLIGPAFVAAALLAPSVIAVFDSTSIGQSVGFGAHAVQGNGFPTVQCALLMFGVSVGLVSGALAMYHWTLLRRILHLVLFCSLLELFYRIAYGGAVSSGVLLSVPETSNRETVELLAGHAALTWGLLLVALLAAYALVVSWSTGIRISMHRCVWLGAISVLLLVASLAIAHYQIRDRRLLSSVVLAEVEATFPIDIAQAFSEVAVGVFDARRQASRRANFRFPQVRLLDAASRGSASEIYVIIVGETSRRANWSLFGYPRVTTPRLDALKGDLILFDQANSNATTTILSVPLALTRAAPATRSIARSEKSIITLMKQAGFETFWISNQERPGVLTSPIAQIAYEADHVSFHDYLPRGVSNDGLDSNLLSRLDDALANLPQGKKAVVFLHMEGSHFAYRERYPADFRLFQHGKDAPVVLPEPQMTLVDEYDNSVYFTDYNVRAVIDRLTRCQCRAGLIFFSDHGERLFDNGPGDHEFGHGFPTVSRPEIEIPFFLWLSNAYREANPLLVARLQANTQSVVQLHSLFETISDLAGVDYGNRTAELSLFSDKLRSSPTLDVLNMHEETVSLPARKDPDSCGPASCEAVAGPPNALLVPLRDEYLNGSIQ